MNDEPCGAINLPLENGPCTLLEFDSQNATPSLGVTSNAPSCANVGNDVWFTMTMPEENGITIDAQCDPSAGLVISLYSGPCERPLTEIICAIDGPGRDGSLTVAPPASFPAGQVLTMRVWSRNTLFTPFSICARLSPFPANDDPCNALPIEPLFGCLMTTINTAFGTRTPADLFGEGSIPDPSCGGVPNNDIWYTTVVPPNGEFALNMDDGEMSDAAFAVYRFLEGSCPDGGQLVEVANSCTTAGSDHAGAEAMPAHTITGLTPGATVYIRVWLQSGSEGRAWLCASRTDELPVVSGITCYYTLRMMDSAGNGWNGSYVEIDVSGVSTAYTINNGEGNISFPIQQNHPITISYHSMGGFQNQISYTVVDSYGMLIYWAVSPPPTGLIFVGIGNCMPGPNDCNGARYILHPSGAGPWYPAQSTAGVTVDLDVSNAGCLVLGEQNGTWITLFVTADGPIAYEIEPMNPGNTDLDFALWGPISAPYCPPSTQPIRCSFAEGEGPTGLNFTASDSTEDANGDGWVEHIDALNGQRYMLYVNGHGTDNSSFRLNQVLPTVVAAIAPASLGPTIVPNPVSGDEAVLSIDLEAPDKVLINILDAAGRSIHALQATGAAGERRIPINTAGLPAGSYTVLVSDKAGAPLGRTRMMVFRD